MAALVAVAGLVARLAVWGAAHLQGREFVMALRIFHKVIRGLRELAVEVLVGLDVTLRRAKTRVLGVPVAVEVRELLMLATLAFNPAVQV